MSPTASARAWPRAFAVALLVTVLTPAAFAAAPPATSAAPAGLSGEAFGIELCPQAVCGAATFIGYFRGDVDGRAAAGWWTIATRHDALPDAGAVLPSDGRIVTGGRWSLSMGGDRSAGAVTGGSIANNGDDTFAVTVALGPAVGRKDGGLSLAFTGTLDHRTFPFTARGTITGR
ncbi:MAG: hypothetical protein WEB13_04730 [Dehalococcoidia bacterium]